MRLKTEAWKLSPAGQISRRKACALLVAAFIIAEGPEEAVGRMIHGGVASTGGGGSTLLTTITLLNTSVSTQASDFIAPLLGHAFCDGDIAAGTAPIFKLAVGGTIVPFSMGVGTSLTYYDSGCLKFSPFLLRVPTSVAGNGSVIVEVWSGGTIPPPSGLSNSVLTTGVDLNKEVVGLDNLSGTWTSSLAYGISLAASDNVVHVDGDAGFVKRFRAPFRQSGADHGYLECYWHVIATKTAAGTLGGIRYLPVSSQPWDATGLGPSGANADWMSFSSVLIKDGASTVLDLWPSSLSNVQNFSFSSGNSFTVANGNNQTGACLRLTTNGTLPKLADFTGSISGTTLTVSATSAGQVVIGGVITGTGVAANTYVTRNNGGNFTVSVSQTVSSTAMVERLSPNVSMFNVFGNSSVSFIQPSSNYGSSYVTGVDNGAGTHTMTAYPYLPAWTSMPGADVNGEYNYIQGSGTIAADCTIQVKHDKYYLRKTKMIPPYDFRNVSATNYNFTATYQINGAGPMGRDPEQTGAAPNIGWLPQYQATYLFTQSASDRKNMVVSGLSAALTSMNYRRKASNGTIICVNNGPTGSGTAYSGMMTPNPNYTTLAGIDTRVDTIGFGNDLSHGPNLPYLPYHLTGRLEFLDFQYQWMTAQIAQHQNGVSSVNISTSAYSLSTGGGRNVALGNGTTVYGATLGTTASTRYDAWLFRNICCAASFGHPESASYRTYANDFVAATSNLAARAIALSPTSYLQTWGLWLTCHAYYGQPFMHNYAMITLLQGYNQTGNTGLKTACQKLIDWWNHVAIVAGVYGCISQNQIVIQPNNTYDGPLLDDDIYICGRGGSMRWTSGSANFTYDPRATADSPVRVPVVGDLFMWSGGTPAEITTPCPAAFTEYVPYYLLTVSGSGPTYTVTLTATKSTQFGGPGGGSAISNTDNDPGYAIGAYFKQGTPTSTGGYSFPADAGAPLAQHRGVLNTAVASGLSVNSTAQADVNSHWTSTGSNFNDNVIWAMTNSYAPAA